MMRFGNLCLMLIWVSAVWAEDFYELHVIGEYHLVLLRLDDTISYRLIDVTAKLKVSDFKKVELGSLKTMTVRATPQGDKRVPTLTVLGGRAPDELIMFHTEEHRILSVDLQGKRPLTGKEILFPRHPKIAVKDGDGWLLVSGLVTSATCSGACECAYFHRFDATWKPLGCFGPGKSFMDSFVEGDIPAALWWAPRKQGVIYYHKTHALYQYQGDGGHTIVQTSFEDLPGSRKRSTLSGGEHLSLTFVGPEDAQLYRLDGDTWRKRVRWPGKWVAAAPINGFIVLVDPSGDVIAKPLSSD